MDQSFVPGHPSFYPSLYQNVYPDGSTDAGYTMWSFNLSRLYNEKEFLENSLADCVTYLHVLRKKHAATERRLTRSPRPSRTKRKTLQHVKHNLEKDIRNKEQAERTILSSLNACKANIDVAKPLPYPVQDPMASSSSWNSQGYSSSREQSYTTETSSTELNWGGWTDDAVISPFQKQRSGFFDMDDVAPEQTSEDTDFEMADAAGVIRSPTLSRYLYVGEDEDAPDVPPNTAVPLFLHSTLSPEAAVFQYQPSTKTSAGTAAESRGRPQIITHRCRRSTHAGIDRLFEDLSLQSSPERASSADDITSNSTPPRESATSSPGIGAVRRGRAGTL